MEDKEKIDKKALFQRIDEISDFMKSGKNRTLLMDNIFPNQRINNTKRYKDYQVIYTILADEFGDVISQVTVYRILKIKEASYEKYREIKNNDISIKAAYEELYRKDKKKKPGNKKEKPIAIDQNTNNSDIKPNITQAIKYLEILNEQLKKYEYELIREVGEKQFKELDQTLFKLRKTTLELVQSQIKEYEDA